MCSHGLSLVHVGKVGEGREEEKRKESWRGGVGESRREEKRAKEKDFFFFL